MLNILPGRLRTNVVRPVSHDQTEVLFFYYYDQVESEQTRKSIAADILYSDRIQQEDIEICEAEQRGLQTKGYDCGRFSVEREAGVCHFQTLLKMEYREGAEPVAFLECTDAPVART